MGEQDGLVKAGALRRYAGRGCDPRKRRKTIFGEGEWNQSRLRLDQCQIELACDIIGETGGPHFRDGFSTRCDDKVSRCNLFRPIWSCQNSGVTAFGFAQLPDRGLQM
jgi:hypothetical protein